MLDTTTPTIDDWRRALQARSLSPNTVREYCRCLTRFADMTGVPVHAIRSGDVTDWLATQRLSRNSRYAYLRALRLWSRWLVETGWRDDDPTMRVGRIRPRRCTPHPVTQRHLEVLLTADLRPRTRAYVLLAAYQGLRVAEIAAVRGQDVDLVEETIRIPHGKCDADDVLPMHPAVVELARVMPRRGWWFPSRSAAGHVLPTTLSALLSRVMRGLGIPHTAHSLRHWYGTRLLRETGNLRVTQELLRHASVSSTQVYTAVDDRERRAAIRSLPRVA